MPNKLIGRGIVRDAMEASSRVVQQFSKHLIMAFALNNRTSLMHTRALQKIQSKKAAQVASLILGTR
jgi:hypothetical protein